jgi:hypothetical protein
MGIPPSGKTPRVNDVNDPVVKEQIESVVKWQSRFNVMFHADPVKFKDSEAAFSEFQDAHDLHHLRVCHWRPISVVLYPPDPEYVSLSDIALYSTTLDTKIPHKLYPALTSAWCLLASFNKNRTACVWKVGQVSNKGTSVPEFQIPPLCNLFANYTSDMFSNLVTTKVLRELMRNYELVRETMDAIPNWVDDAEKINIQYEETFNAITEEMASSEHVAEETPFAASETDGTTGISDNEDVRRHAMKKKVASKAPPKSNNAHSNVTKKAVFSNEKNEGFHVSVSGVDSDGDMYDELN